MLQTQQMHELFDRFVIQTPKPLRWAICTFSDGYCEIVTIFLLCLELLPSNLRFNELKINILYFVIVVGHTVTKPTPTVMWTTYFFCERTFFSTTHYTCRSCWAGMARAILTGPQPDPTSKRVMPCRPTGRRLGPGTAHSLLNGSCQA
jgi:hypothetical protein